MDEDTEDTEDGAADAGIAAVVERTLQQAVVSKSLAAGRSGALGTSDSLEAHAPAVPEAESRAKHAWALLDSSATQCCWLMQRRQRAAARVSTQHLPAWTC